MQNIAQATTKVLAILYTSLLENFVCKGIWVLFKPIWDSCGLDIDIIIYICLWFGLSYNHKMVTVY